MSTAAPIFVPTVAAVRRAVGYLVAARTSPVAPGYLCVLQAAALAGRTDDLRPRFRAFFDRYLRVSEAPDKKPYLVPFGRTRTGEALLFNRNVAGSYAPRSIREVNPLHDVLEITATGTYTLLANHAQAVRLRILPQPLPFCATALFLYRDYGISAPSSQNLLDQLEEDFGFAIDSGLLESGIFADDRDNFGRDDFELLVAA